MKPKLIFTALLLTLALAGRAAALAEESASLQFTVAAPDPVMAGDEVRLQTLVVNTGGRAWRRGSYYWAGEIYTLEGDTRKFLAQTETVSPQEDVPSGGAHGVQIPFTVPETVQGRRLLYRLFLVVDGRRILETDYKGFQVIEKEFRPPPPQDFRIGGDVTFSYRNSSAEGWDNHQGITAANIVGKVKQSSFLFNTYIVHSYHRPITPTIVLLNYYAPWGTLGIGDISPTLTAMSMDGQGMRGVSFDRTRGKFSVTAVIGRIVAPLEPGPNSGGRYARYSGGFRAGWQFTPDLKVSADVVTSRDDEHSITISTTALTIKPQQSAVYGLSAEWRFLPACTLSSEFQSSSYRADLNSKAPGVAGNAWKQELRYKGSLLTARTAVSRIDPKFASFASPSVIADRMVIDGEVGIFPADWTTFTAAYNTYSDNLDSDPSKTTTKQTQVTMGNMLRFPTQTVLNTSLMTNTALGKPATVQDNQTRTMNVSITQPLKAHTLSVGFQSSAFTDKTKLSHDLDTTLVSLNGSFRLTRRLAMSAGLVNSATKDKVDSSSGKNNTMTANLSYSMPRRSLAFQLWATMSSTKNDSALTPADYGSTSLNLETVWVRSQSSRFTFGVGGTSRTDKRNPAADSSEVTVLTRYN
ncbi:MAG: hypothetical protein HY952_04815, partial [Elusimicrobia bacterium]|nr:hypothetical protein [Elusimicrobiota bacterium]